MNYYRVLNTFMFFIIMMNLNKQTCVCVCMLDAKSSILNSHIPPKERKYTASLKEIMKNTNYNTINLNC